MNFGTGLKSLALLLLSLTVVTSSHAADGATNQVRRVAHKESGITLLLIPAGEFMMGSPETEEGRTKNEPMQHRRVIEQPFYLGETEVTLGQFRKFVEATKYQTDAERGTGEQGHGSFAARPEGDRSWNTNASWRNPFPNLKDYRVHDDHPVVHVSWNDAQRFCAHFKLRLPAEVEWEYACRAGSTNRYPWGDAEAGGEGYGNFADKTSKARFPSATNVLFPFDDGEALISVVGRYKPNAWGLRDMLRNVEEWCQDTFAPTPADGGDGAARVLRGGSWLGNPGNCRPAKRFGMLPFSRRDFEGFRVAVSVESVK